MIVIRNNLIILSIFVINISFMYATDFPKVLDLKGRERTISEISDNKILILVFFSTYNCVNCNYELNLVLDSISKKNNLKIIVIGRLKSIFNIIEAFKQKEVIKKYYQNFDIFFDIHKSIDLWPPKNFQDGLFEKYQFNKFPNLVILYKDKNIILDYEKLFREKDNIENLYKILTDLLNRF